jgi:hypothetical protein
VPEVCEAFDVNVPPAVIGGPDAVREAIGSPSGSAAVTLKVRSVFRYPATDVGAETTAARFEALTEIAVVAEPESEFDAVKVAL